MKRLPVFISTKTAAGFLKLGVYQIIGGVIGILFIGMAGWSVALINTWVALLLLLAFLLFGYSILCGILLVMTKEAVLKLSQINQALQLISWTILGFSFKYVAGVFVSVGFDLTEAFKFNFNLGVSGFEFNFHRETERFELNFNLMAIYLLYYTVMLDKKIKKETELHEFSEIGEPGNP